MSPATKKKNKDLCTRSTLVIVFSCKNVVHPLPAMVCLHQEYAFSSGGLPMRELIPEGTSSMGGIERPYLEQVNNWCLTWRKTIRYKPDSCFN